jgi:glycerol-1-phosphate dehydrogenase [NAD(P)+]
MMPTDTISQVLNGSYEDPDGGPPLRVSTKSVVIEDSLEGMEADLVADLGFRGKIAVVSDANTERVLGARVKRALTSVGELIPVPLPGRPHADLETTEALAERTARADAIIAVGSGTINDLCKYVAAQNGKLYAVFGTAPSMNGYTSVNAAITVRGLKKSLPAQVPEGVFLDLDVLAAAPRRMIISGLGDSVCRPTAQADWLLAHLLLGKPYRKAPFALLAQDEDALFAEPEALLKGDKAAMGHLARTLVLSGFGMTICGGSYPASQGEHLISHYVDMLGSSHWQENFHGEQIGVTSLTMARLQEKMLTIDRPRVSPSKTSKQDLISRYGPTLGANCWREFLPKRLDDNTAEEMNAKLEYEWDAIRASISRVTRPADFILNVLRRAGAPTTPEELALPRSFFLDAVRHAREIRNRYTFLDFSGACDLLSTMDIVH